MVKRIALGLAALVVAGLALFIIPAFHFDLPKEEARALYGQPPSAFLELPSGAVAHYRDQGNREGPVLVLIHGSNASLHTWEPWAAHLGDTFRIVTVDLPGHGLTGRVPGDDYSIDGMAAFVEDFVTALGLERFHLGGNSMGGNVTWVYTLAHPERVEKMILVDASGFPSDPGEGTPLAFRLARMPVVSGLMRYVLPRDLIASGLRDAIEDDLLVTEAMIDRYHDLQLYDGNRAATIKRFALERDTTRVQRLGEISQPTLVMWGRNDTLIPVEHAALFAEALPTAEVVIYDNVGHIPMEETPDQSAADVRAFLTR